jgi:hypothetical protein
VVSSNLTCEPWWWFTQTLHVSRGGGFFRPHMWAVEVVYSDLTCEPWWWITPPRLTCKIWVNHHHGSHVRSEETTTTAHIRGLKKPPPRHTPEDWKNKCTKPTKEWLDVAIWLQVIFSEYSKVFRIGTKSVTYNRCKKFPQATIHKYIYEKLVFNLKFDCGIIPENWVIGKIKPIYNNKGDSSEPKNYRPITILSCFYFQNK